MPPILQQIWSIYSTSSSKARDIACAKEERVKAVTFSGSYVTLGEAQRANTSCKLLNPVSMGATTLCPANRSKFRHLCAHTL